jgi:hypothetical protein
MNMQRLKKAITGAALVLSLILGGGIFVNTAEAQSRDRGWQRDRDGNYRRGPWRIPGRNNRNRDRDRDDDWRWERNRNSGWWGSRNYPSRGYGYNQSELQRGYRNGLKEGRDDADDRDSFNPSRHSSFRDGNPAYRDGFYRGYRQGYSEYARYRRW